MMVTGQNTGVGGGRNAASLYETYKKAKVFCPDTHKLVRFRNAHWLQKSLQSLPDLMTLGRLNHL